MLLFGRAEHCSAQEQFVAMGARQGPHCSVWGRGLIRVLAGTHWHSTEMGRKPNPTAMPRL